MSKPRKQAPDGRPLVAQYDATYGGFDEALYRDIRLETWGEDIGQNGWITAAEQDRFIRRLELNGASRLLDVACGSGGPTLRIAERTGAAVTGIDIHPDGIAAARRHAAARGLADRASFEVADGGGALDFPDASFEAVVCIDAINHLPERERVLAEWRRVLRPDGRLLVTDPVVVTGPLTADEIAVRASIGFFLFVPPGANDRLLDSAGFRVEAREDLTDALAVIAGRWRTARRGRAADLERIEGIENFEGQQRFLEVAARLAAERRLSRFAYFARRTD